MNRYLGMKKENKDEQIPRNGEREKKENKDEHIGLEEENKETRMN